MAILGTTGLMGCSSSRIHTPPTPQNVQQQPARHLDYAIEQNELGEFVFCKTGECLQTTTKVIAEAEPVMPMQSFPVANFDNDVQRMGSTPIKKISQKKKHRSGSLKIAFALGSSRINAKATRNLNVVLPKFIHAETIHIRGWADSNGGRNTAINNRLAQERAKKIRAWMIERKVSAAKIKIQTKPSCCNRQDTRQAVVSWATYRS